MISGKISFNWYIVVLALACIPLTYVAAPASKVKFEQERKALLEKIKTINRILAQTESKRKTNTGQLTALNKKIETNNLIINSLTQEIKSINQQLNRHLQKINTLQKELMQLKDEYAKILFLGAKSMHDINILVFIFSANSFHTLLQRLRVTKQYAKIRRTHFQDIKKVDLQLRSQRIELEKQIRRKKLLLQTRQREHQEFQALKQQQSKIIIGLEQQHGKLVKELNQQNAAIKHLDKLISDIVKKELLAKKTPTVEQPANSSSDISTYKQVLSASAKALAAQFTQNRSKLPWPVKTGFISNKFGIRMHPVLPNVQVENLGIDIQTQEKATVHAIFTGVVKTISFVPGMNQVIIIQHGDYHTVYAKLASVNVKVGQQVQTQEPIGIIYTDKNGVSELQLQIWKGIQKLNPAVWLTKQPIE
ncbi:MAG: murein hydrolase activator EnvC family protein [Candidatus Amoebophilus sp.]